MPSIDFTEILKIKGRAVRDMVQAEHDLTVQRGLPQQGSDDPKQQAVYERTRAEQIRNLEMRVEFMKGRDDMLDELCESMEEDGPNYGSISD